jgi:hypothetical protein
LTLAVVVVDVYYTIRWIGDCITLTVSLVIVNAIAGVIVIWTVIPIVRAIVVVVRTIVVIVNAIVPVVRIVFPALGLCITSLCTSKNKTSKQ